jgi:hypothetical protein
MTLHDIISGWSADKSVPIVRLLFSVVTATVTLITAIWAAGYFVSALSTNIEAVRRDQLRLEREQDRQQAIISGLPERITRVETKLDKANEAHGKTLSDIKEILELRAYVPNSVPKRRP